MRKFILLLVVFIMGLQLSSAQDYQFGLYGSPTLSWTQPKDKKAQMNSIRIGFNYGALYEYYFSSNYGISTGVTVSHKGGKHTYQDSLVIFSGRNGDNIFEGDTFSRPTVKLKNIQYLEVPLTLKLMTNEIGYMTYFLQFGVVPGLLLQTKGDIDGTNNDKTDANLYGAMSLFNFSMQVGGGIEYSLGGSTALIGGLYFNNGFDDVTRFDQSKIITNNVEIRVGFLF